MRNLQPQPYNIRYSAIVTYNWHCPKCGQVNYSQRPARDEYVSGKCGKCHQHYLLDYHREATRANNASADAANWHLSAEPQRGIPRKSAKNSRRPHAGNPQKRDADESKS